MAIIFSRMRCLGRDGAKSKGACVMGNVYIEEGLRKAKRRVDDRIRKELKAMKHKENVSAFVDFASNLFTVLGSSGVSSLVPKNKASAATYKNFKTPPRDYNGVVAGNMFRAYFSPAQRGLNSNNV